jgi:hypothetical protein
MKKILIRVHPIGHPIESLTGDELSARVRKRELLLGRNFFDFR